ncbi:MAG: FHA domain-containing protein [Vicinamibacteria bacterium]|jgi:hypothetical protein|nr:FHA domain-containing protein [Vicinamibacteria bacterium]
MSAPRLIREDGTILEIPSERSVLGRDASCDVVVADKSVSRRHALVERRGDTWWVVDQGSANGIFLGGLRVSEGPLIDGQEFGLGLVRMRVEVEAAPAAVAEPDSGGTVLIPVSALGSLPAPPAEPAAPPDPLAAASAALGLSSDASPDEVRRRLAELEADLGARIQAAPTAHLRSTYAASLDEARAAAAVLLPLQPAPEVAAADLPSAQPIVGAHIVDDVKAPARAAPAVAPARSAAPAGPPQSTMIVASLTVILIGLSLFFWLSARASRQALAEVKSASDTQKVVTENQGYETTRKLVAAQALENGQVALCNNGPHPIEVRWLGALAASRGPSGELRIEKFMSSSARCISGAPRGLDVLVAGERKSTLTAGSCTWDGRALFVAIEYAEPGEDAPVRHLARTFGKGNYCIDLASGSAVPLEAPPAR